MGMTPEDSTILSLFEARCEDAVAECERKYGGYCKAIALAHSRKRRGRRGMRKRHAACGVEFHSPGKAGLLSPVSRQARAKRRSPPL